MTCIHGLDENNCPTCRISKSTTPVNPINRIEPSQNSIRTSNPFFEKNQAVKNILSEDLEKNGNLPRPKLLQQLPKPMTFGEIPNFANNLFEDRIGNLKLNKVSPKTKIKMDKHELELD